MTASAPRRPRVLVVDDEVAIAGLHKAFVEAHGSLDVVGVAHTGAQALALVEELQPDLVLLDLFLPDINGLEVLGALRARTGPPVDVIAITAARELESVRAAIAGGVLHYLVKPFSAEILRSRLDDYLRHRAEVERTSATVDQAQVDRLLRSAAPVGQPTSLPKGLSTPTLQLVVDSLRAAGAPTSASDLAERAGMSRVSARRYLEHLVSVGRAEVGHRYGAAGRPERLYRWVRD